jgi:hypothetical protein
MSRALLHRPIRSALPAQLPLGILPGVVSGTGLVKTGPYTVANADKSKIIELDGATFYTLTLSAASGYDADFIITVANTDTTRAKTIAPAGLTSFLLFPGQSCIVFNASGTWMILGPGRWKPPPNLTLNVNSSVGNDANDGLATGSGNALATAQAALDMIANSFDFSCSPSFTTTITVLLGANDTTGLHWGPHDLVGSISGGGITLDGGGFSMSATGDAAIHLFFGAVMYIQNITLNNNAGAAALTLEHCSKAFIKSGVTFAGGAAGSHMQVMSNSSLEIDNNYSFNGNAGAHILAQDGGLVRCFATATATANATFTWTVIASNGAIIDFTNGAFSIGAFTITARRWEADNLGLVVSATGAPNTFFPGSSNGTTSGGGQGV